MRINLTFLSYNFFFRNFYREYQNKTMLLDLISKFNQSFLNLKIEYSSLIQAHLKKKDIQRLMTLSKFISANFLIIFSITPLLFEFCSRRKKRIDRSIREKFKFNIARNTPKLSAQLLKIPLLVESSGEITSMK